MMSLYADEPARTSLLRAFSLLAAAALGVLLFLPWGRTDSTPLCPLTLWLEPPAGMERLAALLLAAGTAELLLLLLAGTLLLCPVRERALLRLLPACYSAAFLLPAGLLWCAALVPDGLSPDWRVLLGQLGAGAAGLLLSREFAKS